MAAPGLDVCEWWDWVPPGVCLYVDLPVPPSRGVEEALTLHVLVSALCPYCCVFCQRSLSVPSAETLVRDLVDADAVRAAADAVGEALAGLGYRRLALRQATAARPPCSTGSSAPTTSPTTPQGSRAGSTPPPRGGAERAARRRRARARPRGPSACGERPLSLPVAWGVIGSAGR